MQLAFILLAEPVELDPARIRSALAKAWDEPIAVSEGTGETGVAAFSIGETDSFFLMPVAAPIPDNEAEAMAEYSVSSLGTGWQPRAHESHLIATLQEGDTETALRRLSRFTRLLAGTIDSVDHVLGVYWGDAHATHDPDFFRDIAMDDTLLPVHLWNGVSFAGDGERVSLLSLGMAQLGQPDLKLTGPRSDGNAVIAYFFDLLSYAASRGQAIAEGETVGRSAGEKLVVRHEPSPLAEGRTIWCVDLPLPGA